MARTLTKSPKRLGRLAVEVAQASLPAYSSARSRRDFTQHQLFAILVLRQFFRADYRGICALLTDWSDLRDVLALKKVPHYSTLCYAEKRLLDKGALDALLRGVFERARALNLLDERPEGAIDATGLESGHASAHYLNRRGDTGHFTQRHWPKLTIVCDTGSYLIAGAAAARGPSNDVACFIPALTQAAEHIHFDRILADKAYDAEYAHALCRDALGIRSTVIPLNPRRFKGAPPKTKYRLQMHTRFLNRVYGHRWHVESLISQTKRRLGSALRARNDQAQQRECYLRVVTHDLMVIKPCVNKVSTEQSQSRIPLSFLLGGVGVFSFRKENTPRDS